MSQKTVQIVIIYFNGNIVPNPSKEWTGGDENGEMELPV